MVLPELLGGILTGDTLENLLATYFRKWSVYLAGTEVDGLTDWLTDRSGGIAYLGDHPGTWSGHKHPDPQQSRENQACYATRRRSG